MRLGLVSASLMLGDPLPSRGLLPIGSRASSDPAVQSTPSTTNMIFCPGGGMALPGQCGSMPGQMEQGPATVPSTASSSGMTVAAVPPSIAPSSTVPASVTNVATALNVSPATIQGDTSGFWQGFYAALAKQSIDPASSTASVIQAAYQQYNGGAPASSGSDITPVLLIGGGLALLLLFGSSKS